MAGTNLTKRGEVNALAIAPDTLPKVVQTGIIELIVAFPTVSMAPEDARMRLGTYAKAVGGFPLCVVVWSLDHLLFNNPRNTPTFTQPPTPQDAHALCKRIEERWRSWVLDYFCEGKTWGQYLNYTTLKMEDQGPPPFAEGCLLSDDFVMAALWEWLSREDLDAVVDLPEEKFNAIPPAGFPDCVRDKLIARRGEKARRAEQEKYAERARQEAEDRRRLEKYGVETEANAS